jgi:hypothetical protein
LAVKENRFLPFLLLALLLAACASPYGIPRKEYNALAAFYAATDGANWSDNRRWMSEEPPCTWYGILCEDGHVVSLTMNWNNLRGELPPELGDLSQLRQLVLYFNLLDGPLPPELGRLDKLEVLILHNNDFEGGIPAEFGELRSLRKLDLVHSGLSGPLPPELGELDNLEVLNLKGNEFSGVIPAEWAGMTSLENLFLSNNELEGAVPEELTTLPNLIMFSVLRNPGITEVPEVLDALPDTAYDLIDFSDINEANGEK